MSLAYVLALHSYINIISQVMIKVMQTHNCVIEAVQYIKDD